MARPLAILLIEGASAFEVHDALVAAERAARYYNPTLGSTATLTPRGAKRNDGFSVLTIDRTGSTEPNRRRKHRG